MDYIRVRNSLVWLTAYFFSKHPISLTVTKILNTVSHYGISMEVKWNVYTCSEVELSDDETMCGSKGGDRGSRRPWKITSYMGFYRN